MTKHESEHDAAPPFVPPLQPLAPPNGSEPMDFTSGLVESTIDWTNFATSTKYTAGQQFDISELGTYAEGVFACGFIRKVLPEEQKATKGTKPAAPHAAPPPHVEHHEHHEPEQHNAHRRKS